MTRFLQNLILMASAALFVGSNASVHGQAPIELDNHAFRLVLGQAGLEPLDSVRRVAIDPERTIVIVFGETSILDNISTGLEEFVRAGGAVLVATDRPPISPKVSRALGVAINSFRGRAFDPCYGDSADCPFVCPASNDVAGLFETSSPIATNRPSVIGRHGEWPVLAWLRVDASLFTLQVPGLLPFAVGGSLGKGRVLVIADHSIFINGMMLPRSLDNGNLQFAFNCVRWLRDGKRDRVFFVDEGRIETNFDIPLQTLPEIPLSPTQMANVVIAAAEKENLFNRLILDMFGHRNVLRVALLGVTAALLAYGVFRLMRAGHPVEPQALLLRSDEEASAAAVAEQRNNHVISEGNYGEAGRDLARSLLADLGYDPVDAPTPESLQLRAKGNWWQRRALASQARKFWHIAYGPRRGGLSRRNFARLLHDADKLRLAVQRGTLVMGLNE